MVSGVGCKAVTSGDRVCCGRSSGRSQHRVREACQLGSVHLIGSGLVCCLKSGDFWKGRHFFKENHTLFNEGMGWMNHL